MTREERETIEGRYAVRDVDKYPCRAAFSGTCPSGRDVNFLLAALDEMEADHQMSVNKAALSIKHLKAECDRWQERAELLDIELASAKAMLKHKTGVADYWQKRAEAFERALEIDSTCMTCVHIGVDNDKYPCEECMSNKDFWQFDKARFSVDAG